MMVASGNISNAELERLIEGAMSSIEEAFKTARYIEISKNDLNYS